MPERIPTGVELLDRRLDGGLAPGSVLVYEAPPASQAEVFLHSLATSRPTTYVSTVRSPRRVETTLGPEAPVTVTGIDPAAPGETLCEVLQSFASAPVLIVDPIDPLEATQTYRSVLSTIESHVAAAETLVVLHALRQSPPPAGRSRTHHVADTVFRLEPTPGDADSTTRLSVPKVRGGTPLREPVTLSLTDTVAVDPSRQIA